MHMHNHRRGPRTLMKSHDIPDDHNPQHSSIHHISYITVFYLYHALSLTLSKLRVLLSYILLRSSAHMEYNTHCCILGGYLFPFLTRKRKPDCKGPRG